MIFLLLRYIYKKTCASIKMAIEFNKILIKYKNYIDKNEIPRDYYNYHGFYDIPIIENNIDIYEQFINSEELMKYNKNNGNNTYLYFKALYYYCKKEYYNLLMLSSAVVESNIYLLVARYYENLDINYYHYHQEEHIKEHYGMAINCKNVEALLKYADYYMKQDNLDMGETYYKMSLLLDSSDGMCNLGYFYIYSSRNPDLAIKYYMMAESYNNPFAISLYIAYCRHIKKDFELMKINYVIAIEKYKTLMELHSSSKMKYYYLKSVKELKYYCKTFEGNESNYYKYIYYPRILTIILSFRYKNKHKNDKNDKNDKQNNIFLPEEIYSIIYNEYIL